MLIQFSHRIGVNQIKLMQLTNPDKQLLETFEPCCEKTRFLHMRKQSKADQRLGFRYINSKIPLLSKSEISSDLVGNPEDRFSHSAAYLWVLIADCHQSGTICNPKWFLICVRGLLGLFFIAAYLV